MSDGDDRHADQSTPSSRGGVDDPGARADVDGGAVPDFSAVRRHVIVEVIAFETRLRSGGATVSATASLDAARALGLVGLSDRGRVADALRGTFLTDHRDAELFDAQFPSFWRRLRTGIEGITGEPIESSTASTDGETPIEHPPSLETGPEETGAVPRAEPDGEEHDRSVRLRTDRRRLTDERDPELEDVTARQYSPVGVSEHVENTQVTLEPGDVAAIDRFAGAIAAVSGRRRHPGSGRFVDARRALRASLATGGTPLELPTRAPVVDEHRVCLLVDVSRSVLDTVDRGLLLGFTERLQTTARTGRVFAFDDGFVDVTTQFERADGDPATALREAQVTWGGGTKIGAALETLRDRHRDRVDQRTTVVLVSDGLDVGDPEALERGITWLAGRAGGIVWLNPLASSPRYEPRSRGMAACLPYVDALFGFATPDDLVEAARQLEHRGLPGPVGYEYDPRRRSEESTTAVDGR